MSSPARFAYADPPYLDCAREELDFEQGRMA